LKRIHEKASSKNKTDGWMRKTCPGIGKKVRKNPLVMHKESLVRGGHNFSVKCHLHTIAFWIATTFPVQINKKKKEKKRKVYQK